MKIERLAVTYTFLVNGKILHMTTKNGKTYELKDKDKSLKYFTFLSTGTNEARAKRLIEKHYNEIKNEQEKNVHS
jgi:hypothetical protein